MRRVLVLLARAATLLVLAAGPAAADPGNQNTLSFTLNCGSAAPLREAAKSEETGHRDARALYPSIHALGSGKGDLVGVI